MEETLIKSRLDLKVYVVLDEIGRMGATDCGVRINHVFKNLYSCAADIIIGERTELWDCTVDADSREDAADKAFPRLLAWAKEVIEASKAN